MVEFYKPLDKDNQHDTDEVKLVCYSDTLSDLLESFTSFLKACGYSIKDNEVLEIIQEGNFETTPEYNDSDLIFPENAISIGEMLDHEENFDMEDMR